jgi:late competence protein required for DNA uptake (superfamily II DNA/RNA helicase)
MAHTKICSRCRKELPIEEFEKLKVMDSRGGYSDYCNECLELNRSEFKKNPPKYWKQYKKDLYGR